MPNRSSSRRGHVSTASTSSRAALRDDEGVIRSGPLAVRQRFFRNISYVATLTRKSLVLAKGDKTYYDLRVEDFDDISLASDTSIQLKYNKSKKIVLHSETKSKAAGWLAVRFSFVVFLIFVA
jgi:hypothetical protein